MNRSTMPSKYDEKVIDMRKLNNGEHETVYQQEPMKTKNKEYFMVLLNSKYLFVFIHAVVGFFIGAYLTVDFTLLKDIGIQTTHFSCFAGILASMIAFVSLRYFFPEKKNVILIFYLLLVVMLSLPLLDISYNAINTYNKHKIKAIDDLFKNRLHNFKLQSEKV